MENIINLLVDKFIEIEKRTLLVLDQLSDEQVNWSPNEASNSITNLIVHISENIHERISKGINNKDFIRNRDAEFENMYRTKAELKHIFEQSFEELKDTTRNMTETAFLRTQVVRDRERTHLDMLFQCAAHFSEHMGQILYIAKIILDDQYVTTTLPKKKIT
ncbi:DinB family protein [Paenibacillus eucommiae]|uniref:Damage-inducible protein DinB n=1 Tax=Paenibacillus eucommiae TaxID=1355755 RepID=A0ABS4IRY2_9BACL|nr:DinB family protein [Paenibacillus eucommiae]MBP1989339.1 putative damage-inducible protein DinB [Paenibacillus eucommiae]